jgi:hypothetical protein
LASHPSSIAGGFEIVGTVIGVIIWIVLALAFAFICAKVALNKGRSPLTWGILGLVFPVIALIVILVLPRTGPRGSTPL